MNEVEGSEGSERECRSILGRKELRNACTTGIGGLGPSPALLPWWREWPVLRSDQETKIFHLTQNLPLNIEYPCCSQFLPFENTETWLECLSACQDLDNVYAPLSYRVCVSTAAEYACSQDARRPEPAWSGCSCTPVYLLYYSGDRI